MKLSLFFDSDAAPLLASCHPDSLHHFFCQPCDRLKIAIFSSRGEIAARADYNSACFDPIGDVAYINPAGWHHLRLR